jgi:outer membrane protein insertion porin family
MFFCFKRSILFAGIFSACTFMSGYADDVPHYEHLRIHKIDVVGTAQEVSLTSRLKTKEGALFSQEDFDEDLKTLAKEYDRINPKMSVENGELTIKLELSPKPEITAIIWQGNVEIEQDKLVKELGIRPGSVFDRQTFTKAFHKLKTYYLRKGYFEAELDYSVNRNTEDNSVEIQINIKEGRCGQIDEIVFHNLTKKEEDELLDLIFTKTYNFFTSWLTQEGNHNPEILRQDELTIVSFLHNEGYADASVTTRILPAKKSGRIIIDIDVDKGALYHIANVSIKGNTLFTSNELLAKIGAKSGNTYSPEQIRQSVKTLQDIYGSKGYIDAQISPEAALVDGKHEYNLNFDIVENARFRVGLIKVFGNQRTDTSVILHEIFLTPGEIFDSTMLSKSEERLRNIGYFKNVNIYAVKSNQRDNDTIHFRDVYVEVEENPKTANLQFFLAYSTAESVSGGVVATETNFNSKGFLNFFKKGFKGFRGGGEYLAANVTVGKKQLSYSVSWTKPYFMDTPWIVGFDASKMRNSYASSDYTIKANNLTLFGHYPLNAFVKAGLQYRINHSFINLKHVGHSRANQQLINESKNGGLISAIGPQLLYDSTDNPQAPRRGLRSTLSGEYAGLGGDHQFLKGSYINSMYWSPYQFGLFRFRGNMQFIKTLGSTRPSDLPIAERFFIGGEQSIRGYSFNTVGPHFHDKARTPRGGVSSVLLSAEYDQYIFKKLDAFVFFDAGNVYFKQLYLGDLRYSAGYGLKVKVFGNSPIVVGMGYPLNPQHSDDVKHFFISFGTAF